MFGSLLRRNVHVAYEREILPLVGLGSAEGGYSVWPCAQTASVQDDGGELALDWHEASGATDAAQPTVR